ncbi:hypothetical protein RJ527_11805 [Thalassospiraceae bacterium LMO-SO8]|nr:hypothetical protein [Alphaproteobacteria bacterium LMO-S08]WND74725.1 hypothetical protein RJ527_11805 [Thalassospiraceae bacterium LMO-SO8]|tara:strand:- start:34 stop:396 length:363 start_codon:yes stop_codon:yes gene_type:complete
MTGKSNIKDHILSIRVSSDQNDAIRAAMRQMNIMFLSRFARIAMVESAERVLAPVDLSEARLRKELREKTTNLRKALQQAELNIAGAPDRIDRSHINQVIKLTRILLSDVDKLDRSRMNF